MNATATAGVTSKNTMISAAKKALTGLMIALVAVMALMAAWAPRAAAQEAPDAGDLPSTGDPITTAIKVAESAQEICGAIYGEGASDIEGCLDEIKDSGKDVSDIVGCMDTEGMADTEAAEAALRKCALDEDDDSSDMTNLSLYRMSSAFAAFYTNALTPGGLTEDDVEGAEAAKNNTGELAGKNLAAWRCMFNV